MLRSKAIQPKRYKTFGSCIFCGSTENLTDEHIIPEALSGVGQLVLEKGTCRTCNNFANEAYEQTALNEDLAPIRHILELRRKKRGSKSKPRELPKVSYDVDTHPSRTEMTEHLAVENYPQIYTFAIHAPAGKLTGEDRSDGIEGLKVGFLHLGLKNRIEPYRVRTALPMRFGSTEMVVAKMAYCYAVAEHGMKMFDTSEIRDLLLGHRSDVFNFVGSILIDEKLPMLGLHKFYMRKRGNLNTVIVHLFASFGGPKHEVVIGPDL
ncbi:HNH endonuclease [Aureimonas sp. ME7]|uniref:HNH endonuclease n=1 Tax=Aureimonas sp. ME7 TaxID=2744252 RepID=UPI0015F4BCC9|nr:HNH endonuclease [Aureimonas sp. ME7]